MRLYCILVILLGLICFSVKAYGQDEQSQPKSYFPHGTFSDNGDGTYLMEVFTQDMIDNGLYPDGFDSLPAQMKSSYLSTIKTLLSTSYEEGTKIYLVPDGGICKILSTAKDVVVPGGNNRFEYNRVDYTTYSTNRAEFKSITFYGQQCCKVKLKGAFSVPEDEIPLIGWSNITTQIYDCNSGNISTDANGQIQINSINLGSPIASAPIYEVRWDTTGWRGEPGLTHTRFKKFTGEFIMEVPCDSCRIVKFQISTRTGSYSLIYALKCGAVYCNGYENGF